MRHQAHNKFKTASMLTIIPIANWDCCVQHIYRLLIMFFQNLILIRKKGEGALIVDSEDVS